MSNPSDFDGRGYDPPYLTEEASDNPNVELVDSARLAELERKARAMDWVQAHRVCVTWYAGVSGNPDYWVFRLNRIRYEGPTWLSAVEAAMEKSK